MSIQPNDVDHVSDGINQMMLQFDEYFIYKPTLIPLYLIQAINPPIMKIQTDFSQTSFPKQIQNVYNSLLEGALPKLYNMIQKKFDSQKRLTNKEPFPCQYCGLIFPSSCSMGGHISRVHSLKTKALRQKEKFKRLKRIKKNK